MASTITRKIMEEMVSRMMMMMTSMAKSAGKTKLIQMQSKIFLFHVWKKKV